MAERDWKKKDSGKHPGTEPERSASNRDEKRASRVLTVRDITIFTYQPAPTRPIDSRSLRDEGLARVSINEQGTVTLVKLLRSSGNREYDTEAVDAFRRWRAGRGSAREIDLPLTAVTTGKKGPVRIPLTQGTFTSG
jgi:TonB family protein